MLTVLEAFPTEFAHVSARDVGAPRRAGARRQRGSVCTTTLSTAAKTDPQHWVLIQNVNAARAWFKDQGPAKKLPLELVVRHDRHLVESDLGQTSR